MSEEIKKDKGRRKNLEVHTKRLAQQLKERNAKLQQKTDKRKIEEEQKPSKKAKNSK